MADVWRALNSLSQTMGRRGGITEARLRGADANLRLKGLEYGIERGRKADTRAEEGLGMQRAEHEARMPGLELEAEKAKSRMEMIPINAKDVLPGNSHGIMAALTPDKHGKSNFDFINEGLPGSSWDDQGNRVNKDGSIVTMPRWKWDERYKPSMMLTYAARTDPAKKINDVKWDHEQALKNLSPGSPEYADIKKKLDMADAILSDRKQMATLYAKQSAFVNEGLSWAIMNNADPKFIAMLDREATRTEKKFEDYSGKLLSDKDKLEMDKIREQIETAKAQRKKYIAEAAKAKRGEKVTTAERKYNDQLNTQRFMAQFGISEGLDGGLTGPTLTKDQADAMKARGRSMGLDVYFDQGSVEDTGSGWNPFDNKQIPAFTVRDIVPGGAMGLTGPRQGLEQPATPQITGAAGEAIAAEPTGQQGPRLAPDGNYYIPDPNRPGKYLRVEQDTGPQNVNVGNQLASAHEQVPAPTAGPEPSQTAGFSVGPFQVTTIDELSNAAEAMGLGKENWKAAAKVLADAGGFAVEELYLKPVNEIKRLVNALIASQAEARQNMTTPQPYGIR